MFEMTLSGWWGISSSNNKTLNARLLERVLTGCHYTCHHGMCFRIIHFILISTVHALFLTCLPSRTFRGVNTDFFLNFSDIFLISPTSDPSDFLLNRAVRARGIFISYNTI
jgi:hypothetical protein